MKNTILSSLFAAFVAAFLSGCLTVDSKEYHIKLRADGGGEATIRFINIVSETDDSLDISSDDFQQLIDLYILGTKFEKENPGYRNVKKRLYEQNGVLNAEVTFTFDSLASLRIHKYDKDSPYMYFAGTSVTAEQVVETNGTIGEQWMPVIFWKKNSRDLIFKTRVTSEGLYRKSLLKNYLDWKASQQRSKK